MNMNILLQRFHHGADDTLGLWFFDGRFMGFSIEDTYRPVKVPGETRIPAGRYRITLEYSPRFTPEYKTPLLTVNSVPGFTGIRIHKGNTAEDTEGCLMPGAICRFNPYGPSRIEDSLSAYSRLYADVSEAIKRGHEVILEIRDEEYLAGK